MKITPLDIQQQEFKRSLLGLDRHEVRNFLELVRETVEELVRENAVLREEVARRESEILRHRERERMLQETLLTAQRLSEDMKLSAQKEAEIMVSQAELKSEKILQNANERLLKLFEEIHELRRQKIQFETGMRRILEWHQKLLEMTASGEEGEAFPEVASLAQPPPLPRVAALKTP